MSWRRVWQACALLVGAVLVTSALAAAAGSLAFDDLEPGAGPPPRWAAVCRDRLPRQDRQTLHRCARVSGRVVAVRHSCPPARESHLLVVARLHLFVVKLRPAARAPGIGATTTVVGPLVRARNGPREVEAWSVTAA